MIEWLRSWETVKTKLKTRGKLIMKKTVRLLLAALMLVLALGLTACGSKSFKCDLCGEEKTGKQYETKSGGQTVTVCEDCYEDINNAFN